MAQVTVNIPQNLVAVDDWQKLKNPTWMDEWVFKKLESLSDDKDIEDDEINRQLGVDVTEHVRDNPGDRAAIQAIINRGP